MRVSKTIKAGTSGSRRRMCCCRAAWPAATRPAATSARTRTPARPSRSPVGFSGPQFEQFKKAVDPYAKSQGITITWSSDTELQRRHRQQGEVRPAARHRPVPAAGHPGPASPSRASSPTSARSWTSRELKSQLVAGLRTRAPSTARSTAIPPSINVKSLVFYPKKAWAEGGLTAAHHPRRACSPSAPSSRARARPRGAWASAPHRPPAGRPPTGSSNLVLNYGGTDKYNDWVSHKIKFDSPDGEAGAPTTSRRSSPRRASSTAVRRPSRARPSAWPATRCSTPNNTESNPGCYMFKQGNFIARPGFFPTRSSRTWTRTSARSSSPARRPATSPVEGGGDVAALFSGKNQNAIKMLKFMLSADVLHGLPEVLRLHLAVQELRPVQLPERALRRQMADIAYKATARSPSTVRTRCRVLSVRELLEADDGLDQGQHHPRARRSRRSTPAGRRSSRTVHGAGANDVARPPLRRSRRPAVVRRRRDPVLSKFSRPSSRSCRRARRVPPVLPPELPRRKVAGPVGRPHQALLLRLPGRCCRRRSTSIYPTLQTIFYSFANSDSTKIVGLQNYTDLLGQQRLPQTRCSTRCCGLSRAGGDDRARPDRGHAGRPASSTR